MNETGIIWTSFTWNPVTGCQKISQGCKFCYAFTLAEEKRGTPAFPVGFDLQLRPHKLKQPYGMKPTLIFVNSMSDLFWDKIPEDYVDKIVQVMRETPQNEYQVLTKRPERMLEYSRRKKLPSNFWAGTTIESSHQLQRLELLKQVESEIRFISFEPLLTEIPEIDLTGIHWVITGGESGKHLWKPEIAEKRALVRYDKKWNIKPECYLWVQKIQKMCEKQGVKFFHKQWGGNYPEAAGRLLNGRFYSEIPRLPGEQTTIDNNYLKHIESGFVPQEGEKELTLF